MEIWQCLKNILKTVNNIVEILNQSCYARLKNDVCNIWTILLNNIATTNFSYIAKTFWIKKNVFIIKMYH